MKVEGLTSLFNLGLPLILRDLVGGNDLKHFKFMKKIILFIILNKIL